MGSKTRIYAAGLIWALVLGVLYLTSSYSYLFIHTLAEIFSVAVAGAIFMLVWNVRRSLDNAYLLFIGVAYLFIGVLDLVHTLAYEGMGVLGGQDENLPTQLWITARYLESLSLLVAPFFLSKRINLKLVLAGYAAAVSLLLVTILYWDVFPTCFVVGEGLTPFKKLSEYVIVIILLASIALLVKKRHLFDPTVLRWLVSSITLSALSEMCFSSYVDVYGFASLFGHFLKVISFYCIYKAIIELGMAKPFDVLFRSLKLSEESLKKAHDELEQRVRERTADLVTVNNQLRQQIEERKQAEEALRESEKQLRLLSSQLLTAQETERRRISRELHDELGGALAVLKLRSSFIEKKLQKDQTELREEFRQNLEYIDQIIDNVGRLSRDLSPSILEDVGFTPALRRLIDSFVKNYNVKAEYDIVDVDHQFPRDAQLMVYRIFQEALTNIGKHAQARNVSVKVRKDDHKISVSVEDDGKGFDVKQAAMTEASERGLGLATMDERARMLGGIFHLRSEEGKGTRITLSIPRTKGESV